MTRVMLAIALMLSPYVATAELRVVVVEGLAGEPVYGEQFDKQISSVAGAARSVTGDDHVEGSTSPGCPAWAVGQSR